MAKTEWCGVEVDEQDGRRVVLRLWDREKDEHFSASIEAQRARELALMLEHVAGKIHTGPVAVGVDGGQICGTTP